jgi:hypothetical protein
MTSPGVEPQTPARSTVSLTPYGDQDDLRSGATTLSASRSIKPSDTHCGACRHSFV